MMICTLLCPEVKFSGALIQDTKDEISQIESFCDQKGSNCIKLVVLLKLNSPFQYLFMDIIHFYMDMDGCHISPPTMKSFLI
jgi:hypothetical protein